MKVSRVSKEEYLKEFEDVEYVYDSVHFNELNKSKCNQLLYLIFHDKKTQGGIIGGVIDNCFLCPFSSPFSTFSFKKLLNSILKLEECIIALETFLNSIKMEHVKIILPPLIYDSNYLSKFIIALQNYKWNLLYVDINYHLETKFFPSYFNTIFRNARKNLKTAELNNLRFKKTTSLKEIKSAYQIIKNNRKAKNYPLKLSLTEVLKTIKIIPADFFIVYQNNIGVAAAQVFHINNNIVQVIYWGEEIEYSNLRPINYLAFKLIEFYHKSNVKIIDVGPSSKNGIVNNGLAEFKESIGCKPSLKFSFQKNLQS